MVINYQAKTDFRLPAKELREAKRIVARYPGKYYTVSHFVRCAVKKLIDEENKLEVVMKWQKLR